MNADRVTVARLCVQVFDRLQLHPNKAEQVLALAGAFALITDALRVSPQDAFTAVRNLMVDRQHSDRKVAQFAAIEHFMRSRLGLRDAFA